MTEHFVVLDAWDIPREHGVPSQTMNGYWCQCGNAFKHETVEKRSYSAEKMVLINPQDGPRVHYEKGYEDGFADCLEEHGPQ